MAISLSPVSKFVCGHVLKTRAAPKLPMSSVSCDFGCFSLRLFQVDFRYYSHPFKRLSFSSVCCSCVSFSGMAVRCSVKYSKDSELIYFVDFICRGLARDFAHIGWCFRCDSIS
jgi:hypothetical protein